MLLRKSQKKWSALFVVMLLLVSMVSGPVFADNNEIYPAPSAVRQLTGEYSTSMAYATSTEEFLVVYQDYNDLALASSIRGQFMDAEGNKKGLSFMIAPISRNMPENPFVVYNEKEDNFLVLWNDGISTARRIYALVVGVDGSKSVPSQLDPELGPYESHDSPKAAYNPASNSYAIIWNVRNEFEVVLSGVLVESDLSDPKPIAFDTSNNQADGFEVKYNQTGKNFIVIAQYGSPGLEVLRSIIIQVTGNVSLGSSMVPSLTKLGAPKAEYNRLKKEEFVIWRHVNNSKHYLLGRYRKSTDPVIEFSANLLNDTNTMDVGVKPDGTSMLVAWSESLGDKGLIYVSEVKVNGSKMDENPMVLVDVDGYFTDINIVYSETAEKFIVTYVEHKNLSNPELTVQTYPLDEALNMTDVTEDQSAENIEALSADVSVALKDTTEAFEKEETKKVFEIIETNIGNIEDEKVLVPALTDYIETVEALNVVAKDVQNQLFVEEKLVDMATVLTESVQKIDDKENITKLTEAFIENVNKVHKEGLDQTTELNVTVGDFAQGVIDKIGEVAPEFDTLVEDQKSKVVFDPVSLETQIKETTDAFNKVTGAFEDYYGDKNIREFDLQVTLTAERVADEVQVPLGKALADQFKKAEVDTIGIKVGGTQLVVDEAVVNKAVEGDKNLLVDMSFDDKSFASVQNDITFKKGYTADVQLFVEGEEQKILDEPVELAFDLDQFEFFDEQYNPSLISVFRFNEETNEWEPVGGVYDPVTNTVSTRRLNLSQYTVMQSNKSFSDVENSWAKAEINELLGKGVIDETIEFNPEEAITREEFTTWVTRAYGLTNPEATAPFEDLPTGSSHFIEIASAFDKGIISGSSPTTFNPDGNITKEQMTVILANAMVSYDKKKLNDDLTSELTVYSDRDLLADWASDEMALMIELGVVQVGERGILPQDTVTKEMAASIIKKIKG